MVRLLALLCTIAGCIVAIRAPASWQTVTALIGGGAVALMARSKDTVPVPTADPPPAA